MSATIWAVLPPIIAIALALLTKEVYSSLMVGILAGAMLFAGGNVLTAVETTFSIMGGKIGGNVAILIFLVMLGIMVALVTKSGASRAYGEWASRSIKSRVGAQLATMFLGALIFVDDYFNCLTVGTVMAPVTDKYKISRAKLAYIIDATAAPVCIIAPISSWAAAVSTSLPENSGWDGFNLFLQTIPFNFYAIFTLIFLFWIIMTDRDFFTMHTYNEKFHAEGVVDTNGAESIEICGSGKVIDLILPIVVLIITCIMGMLYTGGILEGANIVDAFANCSAGDSLVLGSFFAIVFTMLFYLPRKVLTFKQFCESFTAGFCAMVPAIFILTLAWTLSGICSSDYLDLAGFVSTIVQQNSMVAMIMPAIFFVIALGLAFATGTSWGTFGILIPIAISIFGTDPTAVITVAATLAGAVAGDHISPISDTTILASAGAQCDHINHVSTQIPYVLCVSVVTVIAYLVAGFTGNGWIGLVTGIVILVAGLLVLTKRTTKES